MASCVLLIISCTSQLNRKETFQRNTLETTKDDPLVNHTDIDNFWTAYDKISSEEDTSLHATILSNAFINKASIGQLKLMEARNYTLEEYLSNIYAYPKFYNSLRKNLSDIDSISSLITKSLNKFQQIYPLKNSAKIYLGIGNFRTNGTTVDSTVLFGAELALSSKEINLTEFSDDYDFFREYIKEDPIQNIEFLSCHEFVHTQQLEAIGTNLMSVAIREGSAEFIAEIVSGKTSTTPALAFGKENSKAVIQQFKKEMFNHNVSYWLWTSRENKFGVRDLGYYVGYDICKFYYHMSQDSSQAINDIIELDYSNIDSVAIFLNKTNYFSEEVSKLSKAYILAQPIVKSVKKEGDIYTVYFSQAMDEDYRGFDYGPMGDNHVLRISEYLGFSDDSKSLSFKSENLTNVKQQILFTSVFRNQDGIEMKPYLYETNGQ